ncbi:MAG: pyruvate kinase [Rhodospirillaceae bacterium]|nr:pyruvate kinase [Rhodospirillaceae bacterium]
MRRHRRARIVATLGPSTSNMNSIKSLFMAGADIFRLNFSHGSQAEHHARCKIIRNLEKETGRPIGILMDLQGPKLRIGEIKEKQIKLTPGQNFRLDLENFSGDSSRVQLPHPRIFESLSKGTEILLDDGRLRLRVSSHSKDSVETEVVVGGLLSSHKGVNFPDVELDVSSITKKDQKDLKFGLQMGVDWVALSFVQKPADIIEASNMIDGRAKIMAKLEKPAALNSLEKIVSLADGIMVARGDLGVELAPEDVPSLQKLIIRKARRAGKPVVVATQMLESMISNPSPTRAEVSDVANGVYDGADALMLSAESAIGNYPIESVRMMSRIIERVESDPTYIDLITNRESEPESTSSDAITAAAKQVADTIGAAAIATYTTSGSTAIRASRERPNVPILVLTPNLGTARALALVWGLHCIHTEDAKSFKEMVEKASNKAISEDYAGSNDKLVITAGVPFGTPGSTNVLRIEIIK